jgi:hypothetical protein
MKRYALVLLILLSFITGGSRLLPATQASADAVAVLTQHNDNQRTGANLSETILNTSNVRAGSFGKLFTRAVDGHIYAQPLVVPGVSIPSQGVHNVVYVATQHNSVYAFDADHASASAPLWHVSLGRPAPVPADFGNRFGDYIDITVEVGITSTPVIDLATNTLYVVTFVRDTDLAIDCSPPIPPDPPTLCSYHHSLHALDITTGAEKFGGPVQIAGSVPGEGVDSVGGTVTFNSHQQIQRAALLLSNGVVYIAFAGYADTDPYHGWLFGYDAATLARVSIFNTTPNAVASQGDDFPGEGGIWQSGQGPSADAAGYIYAITGNGSFSANTGGVDYGDTFLKLDPQNLTNSVPQVADWFTPWDQEAMMVNDFDLGSTGALLIPGTNLIVGGSKGGLLYVVDRTDMGHYTPPNGPDQIVQTLAPGPQSAWFNSPIFWDRPAGRFMYIWGIKSTLRAFSFDGSHFSPQAVITGTTNLNNAYPGGALSLSANGSDGATGIVWASHPIPGPEPSTSKPGMLRAYDAANISIELWNSEADITGGDSLGGYAKFVAPTVANGMVYMATSSHQLVVYGLVANNSTYLPLITGP